MAITALITAAVALHRHDSRVWLVLATVLVPIALIIAVSTVRPLLHPRYATCFAPSVAILAARGSRPAVPVTARVAAGVAFAMLLALAIPSSYADWGQQDWRELQRGLRPPRGLATL